MVFWGLFRAPGGNGGYATEKIEALPAVPPVWVDECPSAVRQQHGEEATAHSPEGNPSNCADDWDWVVLSDEPALTGAADAVVINDYCINKTREKEHTCDTTFDAELVSDIQYLLEKESTASGEAELADEQKQEVESLPAPPPVETEEPTSESGEDCDASSSDDDDDPIHRCIACQNKVLKDSEIISSSYRAMTGPGYLTSSARNVIFSKATQEAVYTSGRYTVKEVSCEKCSTVLGITYVGAAVTSNKYKIGKFLLGRDLLGKKTK